MVSTHTISGGRQKWGNAVCADSPTITKIIAMTSPDHSWLRKRYRPNCRLVVFMRGVNKSGSANQSIGCWGSGSQIAVIAARPNAVAAISKESW